MSLIRRVGSNNRLSLRSSLSEDTARQYIQRLAILYDDEHHHNHDGNDNNLNDNNDNNNNEEEEEDCNCDKNRLRVALEEAGKYADGIGAVEIYRYRERLGDLVWLDMWSRRTNTNTNNPSKDKDKLSVSGEEEEEEVKPIPPKKIDPVLPGTGLVGTIWSQQTSTKRQQQHQHQLQQSSNVNDSNTAAAAGAGGTSTNSITIGGGGGGATGAAEEQPTATTDKDEGTTNKTTTTAAAVTPTTTTSTTSSGYLQWRDLQSIQIDPDTWQCSRVQEHIQLGLTKAAGVCFDCDGIKGIVIYYAHDDVQQQQEQQQSKSKKKTNKDVLNSLTNTIYLKRCASYIGSILAMSEARKACVCYREQQQQLQQQHQKPTDEEAPPSLQQQQLPPEKLAAATDGDEDDGVDDGHDSSVAAAAAICFNKLQTRVIAWYNKCWGGGLQIPPPMELQQVAWTWLGAFVGLLVLSTLNELFVHLSENEYNLVIGPFGAMMTLLYALPGAPASQPRNVILGETVAGAVSMALSFIPIPKWARRAVTPAFGIAAMTALGVVHPPAGAHATIWADRDHDWGYWAIVVFCSVVSVIPATVINNMSMKRRYPTYWGYLPKWLYYKVFGHDDDDDDGKQTKTI